MHVLLTDIDGGNCAAQQGLMSLPLSAGVERLKELYLAADQHRNRHPLLIEHAIIGKRRKARSGRDDTHKVERVRPRERNQRL